MKLLLFVVLAGCAVKCDESNYYVIEMPAEDPPVKTQRNHLQVYWNVPTMQCRSKRIPFENLSQFGIIQNTNDDFQGDKIVILYDPGFFPALFRNETSGKLRYRNGGVPQEGDLQQHLKAFKIDLARSIPDENFNGIGIIDFESWRPIFRQNFGEVHPYQSVSYEIERSKHWWWTPSWIRAEAKQRFEEAARIFMQNTISLAKKMRPRARWGYYGFPYCFNMAKNNLKEACADKVNLENDQIDWLWTESSALYPSVYSSKELTSLQLRKLIRGRVKEAARVMRKDTPILPYFWFRYRDGDYLTETDLHAALQTFNQSEASGFLIWGSSNDVNTPEKCQKLHKYIYSIFGPAIARYTNVYKEVVQYDLVVTEDSTNNITTATEHEIDDNLVTITMLESVTSSDSTIVTNGVTDNDLEYSTVTTEAFEEYLENETINNKNDSNTDTDPNLKSLLDILLNKIFDSNSTENHKDFENSTVKRENNLNLSSAENTRIYPDYSSTYTDKIETITKQTTQVEIIGDNKTETLGDENNTASINKETTTVEGATVSLDSSKVRNEIYRKILAPNTQLDVIETSTYLISPSTEALRTDDKQEQLIKKNNITSTENIAKSVTYLEKTAVNLDNLKVSHNNSPTENILINNDGEDVSIETSHSTKAPNFTTFNYFNDPNVHEGVDTIIYQSTVQSIYISNNKGEETNNETNITSTESIPEDVSYSENIATYINNKLMISDDNQSIIPTGNSSVSSDDKTLRTEVFLTDTSIPSTSESYNYFTTQIAMAEISAYQATHSPEQVLSTDDMKLQPRDENHISTTEDIVKDNNKLTSPENIKHPINSDMKTSSLDEVFAKFYKDTTQSTIPPITTINILQGIDLPKMETLSENTNKSSPIDTTETNSTETYTIRNHEVTTELNSIFFNQDTFSQGFLTNEVTSPKIISKGKDADNFNTTEDKEILSDKIDSAKDKVQYEDNQTSTKVDLAVVITTSDPESLSSGTTSEQVSSSVPLSRSKYIFCIVFYFSVSKCLCEYYGQCY